MATVIKLQIPGGQANPAPPIGPALGQHGLNIQDFCNQFNNETKDRMGEVVPVEITVNEDRTFTFKLKIAPVSDMLKKAAKIKKGSGNPLLEKKGKITKDQVREIAEKKIPDLNTTNVEAAMRIVEGTARQMGLEVSE